MRHHPILALAVAILLCAGAVPAPAQEAGDEVDVVLHSGITMTGKLVSRDDEQVVIEINGLAMKLKASRVKEVRKAGTVDDTGSGDEAGAADDDPFASPFGDAVTPEAREAITALRRIARSPFDHGVREVSGILRVDFMQAFGSAEAKDVTPATFEVVYRRGGRPELKLTTEFDAGQRAYLEEHVRDMLERSFGRFVPRRGGEATKLRGSILKEKDARMLTVSAESLTRNVGTWHYKLDDSGLPQLRSDLLNREPPKSLLQAGRGVEYRYMRRGAGMELSEWICWRSDERTTAVSLGVTRIKVGSAYVPWAWGRIPETGKPGSTSFLCFRELKVNGETVELPKVPELEKKKEKEEPKERKEREPFEMK